MRYSVIYSDLPWKFRSKKAGGSMTSGSAQKYPVMELEDIKLLDIQSICNDNALLFEWVPCPLKPEAIDVIRAWGFSYKTSIYWRKIMSMGLGYWYRGQMEELWVCTIGKVPALRCQKANYLDTTEKEVFDLLDGASCGFIQSKVRKHSRKPEEARTLIAEALKGHVFENEERLELFATEKIAGWHSTGFEVDGKDIRDFISERQTQKTLILK